MMLGRVAARVGSTWRVFRWQARGYRIEDDVRLGHSRLRGKQVRIGEGARIGDRVTIEGDRIEIGSETLIESGVVIGGLQTPRSSLRIGANCVVLHRSYLNTTYPLVLEDDVGVGGYCMIFTHGLWQSAFEGYPVSFGPVTIRRGVWLPWHVFVMPGVEIGEGATIGAGSVVVKSVPPRSLAVGTPAKVIKGPPEYPVALTEEERGRLVRLLLEDLGEDLRHRGVAARVVASGGLRLESAWGGIVFGQQPAAGDVEIVLRGNASGPHWVDLLTRDWRLDLSRPLHSALKLFLRRTGVRLLPK